MRTVASIRRGNGGEGLFDVFAFFSMRFLLACGGLVDVIGECGKELERREEIM